MHINRFKEHAYYMFRVKIPMHSDCSPLNLFIGLTEIQIFKVLPFDTFIYVFILIIQQYKKNMKTLWFYAKMSLINAGDQ